MKRTILLLVASMLSVQVFAQDIATILDRYMDVKNALIKSDPQAAASGLILLQDAIDKTKELPLKNELTKAIKIMGSSGDLEDLRQGFEKVSILMWKTVNKSEPTGHVVYLQFCPMKDAYWLSYDEEILNPYYGSKMLHCGKVSDKKPAL